MLQADAQRIATAIEERMNKDRPTGQEITATVEAHSQRPSFAAPGGGRPTFFWYQIQIADSARVALLDLDQASTLLDDMEPDWDPDRLFDVIRSRGLPIEDAS
ncbi:MAG: hypothetical protein ACRDYX_23780 [Egibacteraceae bacterium]